MSDILERAKAAISYEIFYDPDELELVRLLIAEVERLRSAPKSGLYGKYIIQKTDGSPVDPHADYFVLRLDTDPYARIAALEYAIQTDDQTLGEMLKKRVLDRVYSEDDQCRKRAEAWPLGMIKKLRGEVERLQDFRDRIARMLGQSEGDCDDLLVLGLDAAIKISKRQAARIKELEAQRGRLEAAFLEEWMEHHSREGIGMSQEARERMWKEDEQKAREALEKIRSGEKDE